MFAAVAESFINKYFGRYLKKFDASNIHIGVTGVITISNVQLRTDELVNFQLPYKPVSIFIGTLYADLPFVSGGNFDVRVSDVLVVVEKNHTDLANLHPFVLHKAVQLWIGALYFAIGNADQVRTSGRHSSCPSPSLTSVHARATPARRPKRLERRHRVHPTARRPPLPDCGELPLPHGGEQLATV